MEERNLRRSIQGVVVSDKNDKTIVVLVETHKKHAKYGNRVKYRNNNHDSCIQYALYKRAR